MVNLKRRTGVRLRIQGAALIANMGAGDLACALEDLSVNGCQCRVTLPEAADDVVDAWKLILTGGRIFTLKFFEPEELNGLEIQEAEILWVRERPPASLVFGVKHRTVTAHQSQLLSETLVRLASQKLRVKAVAETVQNSTLAFERNNAAIQKMPPGTRPAETPQIATRNAVMHNPISLPAQNASAVGAPMARVESAPAIPEQTPSPSESPDPNSSDEPVETLAGARVTVPTPSNRTEIVRQERVAGGYPVTFHFSNTAGRRLHKTAMAGRVSNFSESGFLIEGDAPGFCDAADLRKGVVMHAMIKTPESELNAALAILSARPADNPARLLYGVKIAAMAEDDFRRLRELYERDSRPTNRYLRQLRDKNVAELELASLREHVTRASGALNELQRSLEAARRAQAKMLPERPPAVEGFELAALYESCVELSGDLYHFLDAGPGYTGLLIGDVAGHGVEAAMVMSATLRSFAARCKCEASPAAVLIEVNNDLHDNLRRGMFVSAFYAVLEHKTGRLTYSRAGHNPALLITPSEGLRTLDANGLALGIAGDVKFSSTIEEVQITLPPDSLLAMYTDGIPEAMNASQEEFGLERLCALLRDNAALPCAAIVQKIQAGILAHTVGQPVGDDQTLVLLKTDHK